MLFNGRLDSLRVCADNLADDVAVLDKFEGGHSADAELLGNIGNLVDINLVELNVRILLGVLLDLRSNGLARS